MSKAAEAQRAARRRTMLPGGRRDRLIALAKVGFPAAAAILLLALIALPLSMRQEFSFLLSKNHAARSGERLQIQEASYRGETASGASFEIRAESGVQRSSSVPVVLLRGLAAQIESPEDRATVTAPRGEFKLEENILVVDGPLRAESRSGYSIDGGIITIDIDQQTVQSENPVSGILPMGNFRADKFSGDIAGRHIILEGRARMHITPKRS